MKTLAKADVEARKAADAGTFNVSDHGTRRFQIGDYEISYFGSGGSAPETNISSPRARRLGDKDDPMSDYCAGSFFPTLTAAIRYTRRERKADGVMSNAKATDGNKETEETLDMLREFARVMDKGGSLQGAGGTFREAAALIEAQAACVEALRDLLSAYEGQMHDEFDYPNSEWSPARGRHKDGREPDAVALAANAALSALDSAS